MGVYWAGGADGPPVNGGSWNWPLVQVGGQDLKDIFLKEELAALQMTRGDLWPESWQKVHIGEEWDWAGIWHWSVEIKKWLPPKYWLVWCRMARRNVMLNFHSGYLVAGGERLCEACENVDRVGGEVQTPENWLGECEVLEDFWKVVAEKLDIWHSHREDMGRWGYLKERLVGGVGDEWLTLGWA